MVIWIKIFDRYEPVLYVQKDALRHMTVLYVRTKNTMVDVYMSLDGRLFATRKSVREGGTGMEHWKNDYEDKILSYQEIEAE